MKKKNLLRKHISLVFVFTFLMLSSSLHAQYYWSGGQKNVVTPDSTYMIVETDDAANLKSFEANKLKSTGNRTSIKNFGKNKLYEVRGDQKFLKQDFINLKSGGKAKKVMPGYMLGKKTSLRGTGEIVLELKDGINIQEIVSLVSGKVTVKDKSEYGVYVLDVDNWDKLFDYANYIYESGKVKYCHPNFAADIVRNQAITDPLYSYQYYFSSSNNIDINMPEAWVLSKGTQSVRVAVIDDGIEAHEDLAGKVLQGYTPKSPTGYGSATSSSNHGEACAGIIAANHNTIGISGIAPMAQIVPVNIFFGGETATDLANSIDWAWNQGKADVLSNSWGYKTTSVVGDNIVAAINRARTQGRGGKGCIIVFASGNYNLEYSGVSFPANVSGVIAVGAIDRKGGIWNYSSRGAGMGLVTPSGEIMTTDRMGTNGYVSGNYFSLFDGTSAACPQVAGVAALMLSINPELKETEVVNFLRTSAIDMGATGYDTTFGYGRLNAYGAVKEAMLTLIQIKGNECIFPYTNNNYELIGLPKNELISSIIWTKEFVNGASNYTPSLMANGASCSLYNASHQYSVIKLVATILCTNGDKLQISKVINSYDYACEYSEITYTSITESGNPYSGSFLAGQPYWYIPSGQTTIKFSSFGSGDNGTTDVWLSGLSAAIPVSWSYDKAKRILKITTYSYTSIPFTFVIGSKKYPEGSCANKLFPIYLLASVKTAFETISETSIPKSIKIYNLVGLKVYEEKAVTNFNINNTTLNAGVYIIESIDETGNVTRDKVIKTR